MEPTLLSPKASQSLTCALEQSILLPASELAIPSSLSMSLDGRRLHLPYITICMPPGYCTEGNGDGGAAFFQSIGMEPTAADLPSIEETMEDTSIMLLI